ncbi:MAG TPA: carbohydrate porin, partial [Nevskiaceae bacterium]|nr:carbohydrate porin [Nevskiaceae bacterium]
MKVVNCMAIAAGLCVASTGAWAAGGASQAPGFWTWQGFGSRSHLTGDWGGARSELEKDGISLGSDYEAEFGQTLEGGFTPGNHGTGVVNQINFSADFDMDKLVGLRGGTFHLLVNSIWGHSNGGNSYAHFTNRLGTFVSPTEIYGTGLITRLTEAAYEQKLFNDQLDVLIGYSPMGDAFGTVPVQFDFVNSSLFANPVAMPFNTGWENYPTGQWGVSAKWNVTSDLYGQIGVYEANPALSSNSGFHMGFDGATGSVSGVEIGYSPTLHVGNAVLPGVYKLGGVYDSSIIHAGLTPTNTRRGTFLGYFQMQQMLVNFDASADRG